MVASAMQCVLSVAENVVHSPFIDPRSTCSAFKHSSIVTDRVPASNGVSDWLTIPRQSGRTLRSGISSDRTGKISICRKPAEIHVSRNLCIWGPFKSPQPHLLSQKQSRREMKQAAASKRCPLWVKSCCGYIYPRSAFPPETAATATNRRGS
jgi:hypothetical protein